MEFLARPWMLLAALPAGAALYWAERVLRRGKAAGGPLARAARIAMRSGVVVLLVLAAAGLRLGRGSARPACVFALDVSRSMGRPDRLEETYFRARESLPSGAARAACAFAGEARPFLGFADVEDAAAGLGLEELAPGLGPSRTDVAAGLRSALGLIPSGTAGAIVLVSDGRETAGTGSRAVSAALECRARGVPVFALVPMTGDEADLRVESLTAPPLVESGRPVPLVATVSSSIPVRAEVVARRLPGRGALGVVTVTLRAEAPALVRFNDRFNDPADAASRERGVARYEVEVRPLDETFSDGWPENDRAETAVRIRGAPRLLVVSSGGAAEGLLRLAGRERFEVELRGPSEMPASVDVLAGYAAVLLEGLGRSDVSAAQEAALVGYVNGGGGLLVTGGPGSFGAGEWRDTDALAGVLPVRMTPGPLKRALVVLLVDSSGSMRMEAVSGKGRAKMELAREAVAAVLVLPELGPEDEVALVAFRGRAELLLGPVSITMRDEILDSVRDLRADGPTSLVAPLEKGLEVLKASAAEKRVAILLSDGEPTVEFSRDHLLELARGFRGEDTSLHVLGTNPSEEHRALLDEVAAAGGGIAEHESNYDQVKDALRKLFEQAMNRYVREGPVAVRPGGAARELLEGLGEFPALGSLNRTQARPGARQVLVARTGEPVLALGGEGAGRVAIFTSAFGGPWAGGFGPWEGRVRFLSQLLREIMPPPADEGLSVRCVAEGGETFIEIEAKDEEGRPRNLAEFWVDAVPAGATPLGRFHDLVRADQVALGRYRRPAWADRTARSGLVRVLEGPSEDELKERARFVVTLPPPPELVRTGADRAALDEIARASGGRVLASPEEVAAAFGEVKSWERREASWLLALAALGLVMAELVVRLLSRGATPRRHNR